MSVPRQYGAMAAEYRINDAALYRRDIVKLVSPHPRYRFETFYHPYLCEAVKRLNRQGVADLLGWPIEPAAADRPVDLKASFSFAAADQYAPDSDAVDPRYPIETLDFSAEGTTPYAQYNWELFFHVPFLIACQLSQNQRFREAQEWFHYIFDPTDRSGYPAPARFWKFRGLYDITASVDPAAPAALQSLLDNAGVLNNQVGVWMDRPFQPHLIARLRLPAYQKAVVMKYVDNLLAWADQLFRQDGLERLNEATHLYILAADILGPRPEAIPPAKRAGDVKTFNQLAKAVDADNALHDPRVEIENLVPTEATLAVVGVTGMELVSSLAKDSRYFCIPANENLLQYWNTVADRLLKIRHGLNIEGIARPLPLFDPPIDPGLLVRAAAAGVDLTSVLSDTTAGVPHYRFGTMIQKAGELCVEVRALGAALLSALEKRDSEALGRLRNTHEVDLLTAVRQVRLQQVAEATATRAGLEEYQKVVALRQKYYQGLIKAGPLASETAQFDRLVESLRFMSGQVAVEYIASILHLIPDLKLGSLATIGATYGGERVASALQAFAGTLGLGGSMASTQGSMGGLQAQYARRLEEWQQQLDLAGQEAAQAAKQKEAADIRVAITQFELDNHDRQAGQAAEVGDFLRDKFTSDQLYDWMVGQVSALYFQSYQLAYDLARKAERAYQFEQADETARFVNFGHWDSLKKGLLAGERLGFDLKRMELAYLDRNRRELEITRHISLARLDAQALLALREKGECFITLPEELFDADFPGHYVRRIKTIGITIPCVTGPYDNLNATLTLLSHGLRNQPTDPVANPLAPVVGVPQSIVTSSGQNDSGLFETVLRDERYLPFEGAGVVSNWRLELPLDTNALQRDTLADVVMHVRYTARDGGQEFGNVVRAARKVESREAGAPPNDPLKAPPTGRLFSAAHDFADAWFAALDQPAGGVQALPLDLSPGRFPEPPRGKKLVVDHIIVLLKLEVGQRYPEELTVTLVPPGQNGVAKALVSDTDPPVQMPRALYDFNKSPLGTWGVQLSGIPQGLGRNGGTDRLDPARVKDLGFLVLFGVQ